ncbi:hypothetical protein [Rhizobacter sp. OV335]|uniref:hypothetical protein n=1 Tax=Rhizobacter sp. OV335 TaxID=1500264 RepID=UPI000914DB11|nr:hypothetical protein [Rhizobacter sp. OV335]SHN24296.1 hypothetical protein SAMN02787076_04393 [Rhizobacter sp. OV335]
MTAQKTQTTVLFAMLAFAGVISTMAMPAKAATPDAVSQASLRLPDAKVVWIDNDSFAFDTCSAAGGEHVAAVMGALRERLMSDLGPMMLSNGVTPASQQFVTLTPLNGGQNCGSLASRVVFRVSGVSASSGATWNADVVAQTAGAASDPKLATVQLVNDLVHELDVTLSRSH